MLRLGIASVVAGATVALLLSGSARADEGWLVSFEEAKELAVKEGKDILMEFTGSDWCPPCKALKTKVLDTAVFKEQVPPQYVLLKLDNPRDKSRQTPEEIAQYKRLSAEYGIEGVPTIILADAQGRPFARRVGYGGTPAEEYVSDLIAKRQVRVQRDEQLAKAQAAQGVARARLLDEALSAIDSELLPTFYSDLVAQIVELDADNQAGLKRKYETLAAAARVKQAVAEIRRELATKSPEETLSRIDALIAKEQPTGEALQLVLFTKAIVLFRIDKDACRQALEAARSAAPDSQLAAQIQTILQQQFSTPQNKPEETAPPRQR
jgi:thioredoxin-related protein